MLKELSSLYIYETPLHELTTPCSHDITSLSIRATPLTPNNLDICACNLVWLKTASELGADIRITDVDCGGVMWSVASSQQLLENCQLLTPGKE